MANNHRKKERREEIQRIRAEGAAAFHAGKHRQHVPREYIHNMNRYQWLEGYDLAEKLAKEREKDE